MFSQPGVYSLLTIFALALPLTARAETLPEPTSPEFCQAVQQIMASTDRAGNIELFTKEEIEEGKLDFRNSAMMRIAVKWCQELKAAYDNIQQRKEPFRMTDGK